MGRPPRPQRRRALREQLLPPLAYFHPRALSLDKLAAARRTDLGLTAQAMLRVPCRVAGAAANPPIGTCVWAVIPTYGRRTQVAKAALRMKPRWTLRIRRALEAVHRLLAPLGMFQAGVVETAARVLVPTQEASDSSTCYP